MFWLVLFAVLGGAWFAAHPPRPIDSGQNPVFNPWLFAADTLLPIVNLGQDGYWRLDGASQWISSGLVAAAGSWRRRLPRARPACSNGPEVSGGFGLVGRNRCLRSVRGQA